MTSKPITFYAVLDKTPKTCSVCHNSVFLIILRPQCKYVNHSKVDFQGCLMRFVHERSFPSILNNTVLRGGQETLVIYE